MTLEEEIGTEVIGDGSYGKNLSWKRTLQIVMVGRGDNSNQICHGDPPANVAPSQRQWEGISKSTEHCLCTPSAGFGIFLS